MRLAEPGPADLMRNRGFTLLEVLVALVIVAFGMGAVLAALSSSADNIVSLRDRTMAEWVAMNQIADARLSLTPPRGGFSEGDVRNFGGSDWHWRQDVVAVDLVPGLLEIAVRVRRLPPGSLPGSSSGAAPAAPKKAVSGSPSGPPATFMGSSGSSSSLSSSGGLSGWGLGRLSSSSGSSGPNIGAAKLPDAGDVQWTATVIGFRGDSVGSANGEAPDWTCSAAGGSSLCSASSSSGSATSTSSSGVTSSSGGTATAPRASSSSGAANPGSSGGST